MAKKKPVVAENPEVINPTTLDELMGDRFDIYAKDVIQDRAIPDARDGLKPVQRRIIYAMYKNGYTIEKPTKKCAHIVGDVMGKYHPHGDSSIYEALVRMSQTWRIRLPLIDFQGNNGSMDGDGPAAYRYTEARLAAVSRELVRDIDKDTVTMGLTFDDDSFEPTVLPSRFPNMFVNGSSGIAVGMATEIPPHNLKEVVSAIIYRIQHPSCPIETLMRYVPGPDFPTGGILYRSQGLTDIYLTGRGRVEIASKTEIITNEDGVTQIIVTEIPYGVNKSQLVYSIDKLRHDKTLPGIEEVRDETDKTGLRIAIDIKTGYKPEPILAYLNQKTNLKSAFSANMVAIVDGRPQTLNLLSYCDTYIAHQVDVITRRSKHDLAKDLARLSIVEGLIKASSIIDEIIHVIRASNDKADSQANLEARFGFTHDQSEAIVTMQLYKLSHFDVVVVEKEREALVAEIAQLRRILSSSDALNDVIINDLRIIAKTYGNDRLTAIEDEAKPKVIDQRDLVAKETVMVAATRDGYIKRSSLASWKGSNGLNGALPGLKAGDTLIYCGQADSVDHMLIFTSKGNYLYVPVHYLKANKWLEEGLHVNYAISLDPDDKIIRGYAVHDFRDDLNIALLSKKGMIKRTTLSTYPVTRFSRPIRAMKLLGDDEVVAAELTTGNSDLIVFSENGLAVRYNENLVPLTSCNTSGVKAGNFHSEPLCGLVAIAPEEKCKILMLTDLGHQRVFSSNNIDASERMSKTTVLMRTFKSEPHTLLFVTKVGDREAPIRYDVTLEGGATKEVVFEDLNLTPMERYAKRDDSWPKKDHIAYVFRADKDYIDSSIVSFPPPVVETETPIEEEESKPSVEVLKREDDRPAEKFEQISIFGDDDF